MPMTMDWLQASSLERARWSVAGSAKYIQAGREELRDAAEHHDDANRQVDDATVDTPWLAKLFVVEAAEAVAVATMAQLAKLFRCVRFGQFGHLGHVQCLGGRPRAMRPAPPARCRLAGRIRKGQSSQDVGEVHDESVVCPFSVFFSFFWSCRLRLGSKDAIGCCRECWRRAHGMQGQKSRGGSREKTRHSWPGELGCDGWERREEKKEKGAGRDEGETVSR